MNVERDQNENKDDLMANGIQKVIMQTRKSLISSFKAYQPSWVI